MTSKQLVNHLCYAYGTQIYNEEKLKASQELKKDLDYLEKIKDIEEELEIKLSVLFKALEQGIYYKDNHNAIIYCDKPKLIGDITYTSYPHEKQIDKNLFGCSFIVNKNGLQISCCHYGEKWSLRKEDLENEK